MCLKEHRNTLPSLVFKVFSLKCCWKGRALHTLCDMRFHNKFTIKHVKNAVIFVLLSVTKLVNSLNFVFELVLLSFIS